MTKRVGINMCHKQFITDFVFGRCMSFNITFTCDPTFSIWFIPFTFSDQNVFIFICPYTTTTTIIIIIIIIIIIMY